VQQKAQPILIAFFGVILILGVFRLSEGLGSYPVSQSRSSPTLTLDNTSIPLPKPAIASTATSPMSISGTVAIITTQNGGTSQVPVNFLLYSADYGYLSGGIQLTNGEKFSFNQMKKLEISVSKRDFYSVDAITATITLIDDRVLSDKIDKAENHPYLFGPTSNGRISGGVADLKQVVFKQASQKISLELATITFFDGTSTQVAANSLRYYTRDGNGPYADEALLEGLQMGNGLVSFRQMKSLENEVTKSGYQSWAINTTVTLLNETTVTGIIKVSEAGDLNYRYLQGATGFGFLNTRINDISLSIFQIDTSCIPIL
jgi:hypothetical protein